MANRRHPRSDITAPHSPSLERRSEYVQITYQAPLPPPQMLEQYERILPGFSDRLLKDMESQAQHRQGLENKTINGNIQSEKRGQLYAFILAVLAILGAIYLIATGRDKYGIYVFITTFASLVTVFVVGKVQQSRELAKRRKEMKKLLPQPPEPRE